MTAALVVIGCVILAFGAIRAAWLHGEGCGWRDARALYKTALESEREATDFHRRAWLALSEKQEKARAEETARIEKRKRSRK